MAGLIVLKKNDAKELIDKYLIPKLNGKYDVVVGVLNAGKPIADYVSERLGLKVDYVKCSRFIKSYEPVRIRVEGKKEYGKHPLFVDDGCGNGSTLAALREIYPNGTFTVPVSQLDIFQPTSADAPWVRYMTPKNIIIGAVCEDDIGCEWEGKEYSLPKKEIEFEVFPKQIASYDFYPTEGYGMVTI